MLGINRPTNRPPRTWAVYAVVVVASAILGATVAGLPIRDAGPTALVLAVTVVAAVTIAGRLRLLLAFGAVAYVMAIHWVYVGWVVPAYAYSGLINSGVEWPSLVAVTAIAIVPAVWLPVGLERPSDALLWFLYLFGYVPATVIPVYILGPSLSPVMPFELSVAVAFGVLGLMQRLPRARFQWRGRSDLWFSRLLIGLGIGGIAYLIVVFGPTSPPPDLASVYETRAQYRLAAAASPGAGYLVIWLGNVIFPFLMTLGLARARPFLFALGTGGQLLIYTITGLKTNLFSIVLLPILYVAVRRGRGAFGTLWVWASAALVALSAGATLATGSPWPLALFVTRLIAIPGQLTAYYYDFFSTHATYLLSFSFLRWFVQAPYDIEAPYLIGRVYFHSGMDANANIWADAMANFGLVGIIPFTIAFGIVLWILDTVAFGRDLRVLAPVVAFAGLYLANAALFTQILTGGIALIVAFAALMPQMQHDSRTTAAAGSL